MAPGDAEGSWGHSGCLWDLKGGGRRFARRPDARAGAEEAAVLCALAVLAVPVPQVTLILRTGGLFCVRLQFTQEVVLHGTCPSVNFIGMGKH